jgi:hypothetical protein
MISVERSSLGEPSIRKERLLGRSINESQPSACFGNISTKYMRAIALDAAVGEHSFQKALLE